MFRHSKDSPVTAATNGHINNSPNATNDPNGTATGLLQGFVLTKWLRLHLVDLVTMVAMGAIGLGVYYARKLTLS